MKIFNGFKARVFLVLLFVFLVFLYIIGHLFYVQIVTGMLMLPAAAQEKDSIKVNML